MEYAELVREIEALPASERETMCKLARLVTIGGAVRSRFTPALEAAASPIEFFERIYADDCLRSDMEWAAIARALHPDWLSRFEPRERAEAVPTEGGRLRLAGLEGQGDLFVDVPGAPDAISVLLFDDGEVNEVALDNAGAFVGLFEVGGLRVSGRFSIGFSGRQAVIVEWRYRENGSRVSIEHKLRCSCGCC